MSILCLVAFPILSIAQSFDDPLGQINDSVRNVSKDWIKYLVIGLFLIAVFVFFLKRKFASLLILLGAIILFIVWLVM
jgi:uncharacterized membrane protein YraQ (UPF0718 family)